MHYKIIHYSLHPQRSHGHSCDRDRFSLENNTKAIRYED